MIIYYDVLIMVIGNQKYVVSRQINVRDIRHQISTDSLGINWSDT